MRGCFSLLKNGRRIQPHAREIRLSMRRPIDSRPGDYSGCSVVQLGTRSGLAPLNCVLGLALGVRFDWSRARAGFHGRWRMLMELSLERRTCHATRVGLAGNRASSRRCICVYRQGELKRGTMSHVCRGPQSAAMSFHDRTTDREPHTHAAGFGGEEGIEQPLRILG
jgi:hypothetical protein